jgi:GNAT superfamily N-acetyltransferase
MDLNFQMATNITFNHVIERIEQLTFPPIRKKMQTMPLYEPFTGVWAIKDNKIIGTVLADKNPAGYSELFSFLVVPKHRNKGIGNQLLSLLITSLKNQGISYVQTRYRSDWGSYLAIEKILKTHGWEPPHLLRIIAEVDIKHFPDSQWPSIKIPSQYFMFNWGDITAKDRTQIDSMITNQKIPQEFNPYQHKEKICFPISYGLRYQDSLIGWNIAYFLKADTIEYNNLYISENYRKFGYAIALLQNSFQSQYKLNISKATWIVNADNQPMLKIVQKIASKFIDKFIEVKSSYKKL